MGTTRQIRWIMLGKPSFIAHRAAVGHLARVFCPPKPMFYATEQLRRRLRLSNLDLIEPPGQDGRVCQSPSPSPVDDEPSPPPMPPLLPQPASSSPPLPLPSLVSAESLPDELPTTCAICLEVRSGPSGDYAADGAWGSPFCCHAVIHYGCLNTWFSTKNTCPNCRRPLPTSRFRMLGAASERIQDAVDAANASLPHLCGTDDSAAAGPCQQVRRPALRPHAQGAHGKPQHALVRPDGGVGQVADPCPLVAPSHDRRRRTSRRAAQTIPPRLGHASRSAAPPYGRTLTARTASLFIPLSLFYPRWPRSGCLFPSARAQAVYPPQAAPGLFVPLRPRLLYPLRPRPTRASGPFSQPASQLSSHSVCAPAAARPAKKWKCEAYGSQDSYSMLKIWVE